jgi:hypothetical protein
MPTHITMSDLPKTLDWNFRAGIPVEVQGPSGVGKTEGVEHYAKSQGADYGYFELNAATAHLGDVTGILMPHTERHTDANNQPIDLTVGKYAYPYFMRDKFSGKPAFNYKRGCLVIEEYGQAQVDVKRALGQLTRELRNGGYVFPAGTNVVLLSNRPEDRSGVTKDFDFLINRRNVLTLHADLHAWLVWAHEHDITNMSMAFAARNEDKVFANKAPEKQGPWLTPRSLAAGDAFLRVAHEEEGVPLDDPLIRTNLAGIIGEGYAHIFIAFAKVRDKLPSFSSIVNAPNTAPMPKEPDQMMFLAFDLAAKVKRETMKPVVAYMKRMPSDFAIAFYRSAMQRDPTLRSTKEFGDWAVDNLQLLSAVTAA